ncbi:MAG TPA: hypothetical protein VGT24_10825 [Candidatus Acidoferrales bacterium]|nr:hypothetical protein [Candidatus Acidoferrales bacterium]
MPYGTDLPVQPLSNGALIRGRAARQLIRIYGTALCHGPVKTALVPEIGHDTSHGSCEIGSDLAGELLDSLLPVFFRELYTGSLH